MRGMVNSRFFAYLYYNYAQMKRFYWWHQRLRSIRRMPRRKQLLLFIGIPVAVLAIIAIITTVVFAASLSSKENIMNRNKTGVTLLDRNGKVSYEFHNAHTLSLIHI